MTERSRDCVCYRDAPDDPRLSHQVHEGVLDPDQDVGGHPVAAALLDVGARGVGVVTSRRGRPGRHGTVAHRAGTRTGLWGNKEPQKPLKCLRSECRSQTVPQLLSSFNKQLQNFRKPTKTTSDNFKFYNKITLMWIRVCWHSAFPVMTTRGRHNPAHCGFNAKLITCDWIWLLLPVMCFGIKVKIILYWNFLLQLNKKRRNRFEQIKTLTDIRLEKHVSETSEQQSFQYNLKTPVVLFSNHVSKQPFLSLV